MSGKAVRTYPLFERFFYLCREAMFITSRDGKFIKVNHAFENLLGYRPGEVFSIDVLKTFESEADRIPYQKTIEAQGIVHQYPLVLKRKDGTPIPCFIDAITLRDDEGKRVLGYHGIIRTRNDLVESFKVYFNQLKQERAQIREQRRNLISDTVLLSRYMNEDVLEYVRQTGENPLESQKRKVTALFFDIRGSTRIAETVSPEIFAEFLNDILTDIMDLIYGCKGSVNKLIGDGLMATFGAPVSAGQDAFNAVQAAQEIHNYLKTFNDVRPEYLREPVGAGLGLATGTVFAGVIGSVRRQEYTVVGDAVNVASRLEALTKVSPEKVLMDEETYTEVKDFFPCRKVFSGKVRGRTGALLIYGLLSSRVE
ncbi:MAG: PAS domain-containing protein [Spirochaetales bacterium]|jgi:PAS domain S-box-containing protein|nr:PAS domain-containing protein [Spirochaetales bacterium]